MAYFIISRETEFGVKVLVVAENCLASIGGGAALGGGGNGGLRSEKAVPILMALETLAVSLIILLDFRLLFPPLHGTRLQKLANSLVGIKFQSLFLIFISSGNSEY